MRNPRMLEPGQRLGSFIVTERLGRGAMATVYLAFDDQRRRVALKVLHADHDDPEGRAAARLRREVELARRISHAGVCAVFDLHDEDGLTFLSLAYVPGRTLEAVIEAEGRLSPARAARVVADASEGLAAAHALGILHRDLKPGNIMLRPDDRPVLLDFGYATAPDVSRLTAAGTWVGTLQFLAPELLADTPASPASDIYAMGVTLYRCLTGQYPYAGVTFAEIAAALLYRPPAPVRDHLPEIDPRLERIVMRAMSREPHQRFPRARELASALATLAGEDVAAAVPAAAIEVGSSEWSLSPAAEAAVVSSTTQKEIVHAAVLVCMTTSLDDVESWLRLRYDVIQPEIGTWDGHVIAAAKEHVLLAWFSSANDAVRAAVGIQRAFDRRALAAEFGRTAFSIRVGIETGYAKFARRVVLGEAVEQAGLICQAATGGEILIGRATRASLNNQLAAAITPLALPRVAGRHSGELYQVEWGEAARTALIYDPPPPATPATRPSSPAGARVAPPVRSDAQPPAPTGARVGPPARPNPQPPAPMGAETKPVGSTPVDSSPVPPAELARTYEALRETLMRERGERGLRLGDQVALDGLERMVELELARGRWQEGLEVLRSAIARVRAVEIDQELVTAKLRRLHAEVRQRLPAAARPRVKPRIDAAVRAIATGDPQLANRELNTAFDEVAALLRA